MGPHKETESNPRARPNTNGGNNEGPAPDPSTRLSHGLPVRRRSRRRLRRQSPNGGRLVPHPPNFTREAPHTIRTGFPMRHGLNGAALRRVWRRSTSSRPRTARCSRSTSRPGRPTWAAIARIRTDGLTMTNPESGHTSAHPCVSVANTAAGQLRAFANEFGLSRSPSASWAASRRRTTRARTRTGAAEAIETTPHTQQRTQDVNRTKP